MSSETPEPRATVDLGTVTVEIFTPVVGQTFEAVFADGRLPLTLAEARSLGAPHKPGGRAPFALMFHGRAGLRLPQMIYRLEHATLGTLDIFLVQIADDAGGAKLEAIFN